MTLVPMTLRLETVNGPVVEYRIDGEEIQVREFQSETVDHANWRTMSTAELTEHVMKKTIVSQWLRQRLGWRALLRACVADQRSVFGDAIESNSRAA